MTYDEPILEQELYALFMVQTYRFLTFNEVCKLLPQWSIGEIQWSLKSMMAKKLIRFQSGFYCLDQ